MRASTGVGSGNTTNLRGPRPLIKDRLATAGTVPNRFEVTLLPISLPTASTAATVSATATSCSRSHLQIQLVKHLLCPRQQLPRRGANLAKQPLKYPSTHQSRKRHVIRGSKRDNDGSVYTEV